MDITLLVKSVLGFLAVLAVLIFLFLLQSKKKTVKKVSAKKSAVADTEKKSTDLKALVAIIKRKTSTAKELQDALDMVIKHHGTVHKKLGLRAHPDFDIYMDILFTICRHPNVNKTIIVKFDNALGKLNPEYKREINDSITKGLNSRGV